MRKEQICYEFHPEMLCERTYFEGYETFILPIHTFTLGWTFCIFYRIIQRLIDGNDPIFKNFGMARNSEYFQRTMDELLAYDHRKQCIISDELEKNYNFKEIIKVSPGFRERSLMYEREILEKYLLFSFEVMDFEEYQIFLGQLASFFEFVDKQIINSKLDSSTKIDTLHNYCAHKAYYIKSGDHYFHENKSSYIVYKPDNLLDFLLATLEIILKAKFAVLRCESCGRIFVSQRSTAKHCFYLCSHPAYPEKTCNDYEIMKNQYQRNIDDILNRTHQKVRTLIYYSSLGTLYESYRDVSKYLRKAIRNEGKDAAWHYKAEIAYLVWSAGFYQRKYKGTNLRKIIEENAATKEQKQKLLLNFERYNTRDCQAILLEILDALPKEKKEKIQEHREQLARKGYL